MNRNRTGGQLQRVSHALQLPVCVRDKILFARKEGIVGVGANAYIVVESGVKWSRMAQGW